MDRVLILDCNSKVGEDVKICGWVATRRDHGKIVFLDIRDRTGIIQAVATGEQLGDLGTEDVVEILGKVVERGEKMVNDKIPTGKIELQVKQLKILSKADTLPIPIDDDGHDISEETRLKYRYLDLRRPRMTRNLRVRSQMTSFIRNYLVTTFLSQTY